MSTAAVTSYRGGSLGAALKCTPGLLLVLSNIATGQSARLDSVQTYVQSEVARQAIPGLSLMILRGDSVLLSRGFGWANVELRARATDSTIYQSGSVGKQFTATAILLLAEDGRVKLDEPIRRYIPEVPRRWNAITVRHLLTHTSGLPDYTDGIVDLRRDYTEDDFLRMVMPLRLEFTPGTRWSYSNTGYLLLGILIHRVTGKHYGEYLRARIFEPAGMSTARLISESDIVPNRAAGYRLVDGNLQNQEWVSPSLNSTADGALYFSIRDLTQWTLAINHHRVLDRVAQETAWAPVRLTDGSSYPYGLGWQIQQQRGYLRVGHNGYWQGFRASLHRYPDFDMTVAVLSNLAQAKTDAIVRGVAGILEPNLGAPHLLAGPIGTGSAGAAQIPELLLSIAEGQNSALAPGFRRLITKEDREDAASVAKGVRSWEGLGCDEVSGRGLTRSSEHVSYVCYVRGSDEDGGILLSALYTTEWKAAAIEHYSF
jgi:CubicO group peptidase (beta-lactamase class C family)